MGDTVFRRASFSRPGSASARPREGADPVASSSVEGTLVRARRRVYQVLEGQATDRVAPDVSVALTALISLNILAVMATMPVRPSSRPSWKASRRSR